MFQNLLRSRPAPPQMLANPVMWPLSVPLIRLSENDDLTLARALEGILVLGSTGSGKSSGSGATIARSFLSQNFGGLVLTAKPGERAIWEEYCRQTNRSGDLIIFSPKHPYRFNFMDAELNRAGDGAGLTENLVRLMMTILEISRKSAKGSTGGENAEYFRQTNEQLCRNDIDLLSIAKGHVSIPDLYQVVISAPTSLEDVQSDAWRKSSFCYRCLVEADGKQRSELQTMDMKVLTEYFLIQWPGLAEKTRSIIISTFSAACDVLNRGLLRSLFCGETNLTPQAIEEGKIVIVDLPVLEYGPVGQFAQVIWKYSMQRHIERRDIEKSPRPVFLWQDEAQLFLIENDYAFQTTCRAARVATVMLSQNISNFYAVLGGDQAGKAQADSLFGNLNTKIFHCNGDAVTNTWAADLIGRSRQFLVNASRSAQATSWYGGPSEHGSPPQHNAGVSEIFEYEVQPSVFTSLRTGGSANNYLVDSVIFSHGAPFNATGRQHLFCSFAQK